MEWKNYIICRNKRDGELKVGGKFNRSSMAWKKEASIAALSRWWFLVCYGLTVYAHGSPNGYIVAPDRKSAIHQTRLIAAFRSNGYRIARANMMQCYSIKTDGTIPTGPKTEKTYNYKEAWEKTAVKVYGYEGVNAIGIDFK